MKLMIDKSVEEYLSFADERTRAFMQAPPKVFELVREVDALIRDMLNGTHDAEVMAMFLHMNAYYSFLSSVRVALSGHVSSVFPLTRAALESACYAFLLTKDEALVSIWTDRDKGDRERAACRRAFNSAIKETARHLQGTQMEMAEYVQALYEAAIAFGAHPNALSVLRHLQVRDDDGSDHWRVDFTCMYAEDSPEVAAALLACAEYGLAIAYLNALSPAAHADWEALNVRFNTVNKWKNNLGEELRSTAST